MDSVRLVLATRNAHKASEFAVLLAPHAVDALPEEVALPPETGSTFAENALGKARAAAAGTGRPAIADDSGIEAEALGGAPGIRSARYAGEHATDEQNLAKLLREAPAGSRVAYVCALAYVAPDPAAGAGSGGTPGMSTGTASYPATGAALVERVFEARCTGTLADEPRGDGGFGYDPAFLPDDGPAGRTMAELSPAEKDAISHRGRAARDLLAWLQR
jgi:XTP/dITP diphosphohydrolase